MKDTTRFAAGYAQFGMTANIAAFVTEYEVATLFDAEENVATLYYQFARYTYIEHEVANIRYLGMETADNGSRHVCERHADLGTYNSILFYEMGRWVRAHATVRATEDAAENEADVTLDALITAFTEWLYCILAIVRHASERRDDAFAIAAA